MARRLSLIVGAPVTDNEMSPTAGLRGAKLLPARRLSIVPATKPEIGDRYGRK
jgi:hypothetical protein